MRKPTRAIIGSASERTFGKTECGDTPGQSCSINENIRPLPFLQSKFQSKPAKM
jgi:hypothetical protein